MSLVRVRPAEWLAGAAGALLIVSLFLTWYAAPSAPARPGFTAYAPLGGAGTGWQAFSVADVVLTVLALAGLALLVAQATRRSPALPTALSIVTLLAGFVATILVAVELLTGPGGTSLGVGAWLGLAGALGLLLGGWWSMADEHVRGMPSPEVRARPAPPPGG